MRPIRMLPSALLALVLPLFAAGCMDNPLRSLLVEPAKVNQAGLSVSYSLTPGAQARVAQAAVDRARVRLSLAGAAVLDTVVVLPAGQEETKVRLEVPLEQDRQSFDLTVELMAGTTVVARARDTVTLARGENNVAQLVADAVFAGVAAGRGHSCHLSAEGKAFCWGENFEGQLGDGTTTLRATPVAVAGGLTFAQIDASDTNTCALTADGRAFCWGDNSWGEVGDGTTDDRTAPTAVAGGLRFASLAVGGSHKCGLTSAGDAYCWGMNSQGQLGAASTESCGTGTNPACSTTPLAVAGGLKFTRLVAGFWHTCGMTSAGAAYCWGNNSFGQIGTGASGAAVTTPTQVSGGAQFASLTSGSVHTCGLTTSGEAHCWGGNFAGQIGDGTTTQRPTPTPVAGGLRFRSLASHGENSVLGTTCGITEDGTTHCWGYNGSGQLGATTTETCGTWGSCAPTPVALSGGLKFQALDLGNAHGCGVTREGATYCWGSKGLGQLGNGSLAFESTPSPVAGGRTFQSVDAGWGSHACGLTPAGAAFCWGDNSRGGLGNGTTASSNVPVAVQGGGSFTRITTGWAFSCALDASAQAFCWGNNQYGQLGDGTTTNRSVPAAVTGGRSFAWLDIMTSYVSAIAADSQSSVFFWGEGGQNDTRVNSAPVFTGTTGMQRSAAGTAHTCFLDASGAAFCRGQNWLGQLGNGTTTFSGTPVAVSGGLTFRSLTAGGTHTCGVTTDDVAYCWGNNALGHLGSGTSVRSSSVPIAVAGNLRFKSLSAGNGNTCGVTTGGDAYCWGMNREGQVGDGTFANRNVPTPVSGGRKWAMVDAGAGVTCGVTTASAAFCWGDNTGGALGNGVASFVTTPVKVGGGASASRGLDVGRLLQGAAHAGRLTQSSAPAAILPEAREIGSRVR